MNMSKISSRKVVEISVSAVILPAFSVRQSYDGEAMADLQQSVSEDGTFYPIIVRLKDGKYELIAGSRRLRTVQKLGLAKINAIVLENIDDKRSLEIALIENVQRQGLTPFEEARVILKFVNEYKMSLQEIAKKIGRKENFLRQRIQLLSLPKEIQKMIAEKKLSMAHIDTLAGMVSPEAQIELAREAIEDELSPQELKLSKSEKIAEKKRVRANKVECKNAPAEVSPLKSKKQKSTGKKVRLRITQFNNWLKEAIMSYNKYLPLEKQRVADALKNLNSTIDEKLKDLK